MAQRWTAARLVRISTAVSGNALRRNHLLRFFGTRPLKDITADRPHLRPQLSARVAPKTLRNVQALLSTVLRDAVLERLLLSNTVRRDPAAQGAPAQAVFLSPAQIDALVQAAHAAGPAGGAQGFTDELRGAFAAVGRALAQLRGTGARPAHNTRFGSPKTASKPWQTHTYRVPFWLVDLIPTQDRFSNSRVAFRRHDPAAHQLQRWIRAQARERVPGRFPAAV